MLSSSSSSSSYRQRQHPQVLSIRRLAAGVNGIIFELQCPMILLLKVSLSKANPDGTQEMGDNLVYEWYAGYYGINHFCKNYLCFVDTKYLLEFDTPRDYHDFIHPRTANYTLLRIVNRMRHIHPDDLSIEYNPHMCMDPSRFALIQSFVPETVTLHQWTECIPPNPYNVAKVMDILFQLTLPLSALRYRFTHNDLHTSNILVRTFSNNNYINLRYRITETEFITVPTPRMVKIIDYGRCFFTATATDGKSSAEFWQHLEQNTTCPPRKRKSAGFHYWGPPTETDFEISQLEGNISRDLEYMKNIRTYAMDKGLSAHHPILSTPFQTLLDSLPPGTKYLPPVTTGECGYSICNIGDLYTNLLKYYDNYETVLQEAWATETATSVLLGTYHIDIFGETPMKFVQATHPTTRGGGQRRRRFTRKQK